MIPYSKLRKDIDTFFDSPDTLTVYVCLLVRCNYKPEYFESGDFIVDRYKTVMSIDTIAAELKMSRGRVRYSLERLTAAGFISTENSEGLPFRQTASAILESLSHPRHPGFPPPMKAVSNFRPSINPLTLFNSSRSFRV